MRSATVSQQWLCCWPMTAHHEAADVVQQAAGTGRPALEQLVRCAQQLDRRARVVHSRLPALQQLEKLSGAGRFGFFLGSITGRF